MKIKSNKECFTNCNVAGFTYYEGCEVLGEMKVGEKVQLVREDENYHDHYAIAVMYNDKHIGYIPRSENRQLAKFIDLGWGEIFEARIQTIDLIAHPEDQLGIIIYVKRKEMPGV